MFSEAYIKELLLPEYQFIQEGWRPAFGDWVDWPGEGIAILDEERLVILAFGLESLLFLPTLRQLSDMLEEGGCDLKMIMRPDEVIAQVRLPEQAWADEKLIAIVAPDRETAVLRALGEVVKEENR